MSKKLIILELTETNTSFITDNAFAAMKDLTDIRIQNNRISQLKRSMFPVYNRIQTFFFNDNTIENLPDDLFHEMPRLIRVGFENNRISYLTQNLFDGFYIRFQVLALRGNPIKCDCSLKWIANRNRHIHEKYVSGTCVNPKHLAGKEIFELSDTDFTYCQ
ncbi:unnamed protein product [Larinioides sclopetarius]|uniref:LRRCT domain-containing protein n=1 Tax=Larinioides sclopetarius TaxID=280406 RepID=A0AAV2BZ96_9ARAC